jgi:uncharacterized repeat protein (TIGR03803 family)
MVPVMLGLGILTSSAAAQTLTVLHSFTGADGRYPYAGLVQDAVGNLYGTTDMGGRGCGVVFEIDTSGAETVLYDFCSAYHCHDGCYASGGVVRDRSGNLYGSTVSGTVYKVNTSGIETVLHRFTGKSSDGCFPSGALFRDSAGNLYGTTEECGSSKACPHGCGVVFKVDTNGIETILHNFAGKSSDGCYPSGGPVQDAAGNLYVSATECGSSGHGGIYKVSKSGKETVIHNFKGSDGSYPYGTLILDKAGNLYGTTWRGGSSRLGTVFKVSHTGTETVLYSFTGSDGASPLGGVIMDAKGNLYGDTELGGSSGYGTVFELDTTGKETVLYNFTGSDGKNPFGGVIRDEAGNLYSTTLYGGSSNYGTVWKLTP